ncbi:MAG TPA: efflux RND transporter periplasmic adaptor subunit [Chryseosolibacter sp.]
MKKFLYILIPVGVLALVTFRLRSNREATLANIYQYDKREAVTVEADTLKHVSVAAEHFFTGTFEPNREARVSAEVQGRIDAIYVDAGSLVRTGQPLLQLDNALFNLQLQGVDVQLEGLRADVARYTILVQADAVQGVQLEKSLLGLKSAQVQRATLLEQIRKTTIRAPFTGIITAKLSETGTFAAPGIPLLQVTDISQLKFTINVPEADLKVFTPGTSCEVIADAYPDLLFSGEIVMVGSKSNLANSFPVQINVSNTPDLKLKSGMFGRLMLKRAASEQHLVIPASAISGSADQPQVYVITNGKAALQNITISERIGNNAVVAEGLREGDVMVTGGFINLFEGANVTVKN